MFISFMVSFYIIQKHLVTIPRYYSEEIAGIWLIEKVSVFMSALLTAILYKTHLLYTLQMALTFYLSLKVPYKPVVT